MSGDGLPTGTVIVAGCGHGGLAVIRSLGKRGLRVIALASRDDEPALWSRHVSERIVGPHPSNAKAFADFLVAQAPRWRGAVIFDTTDFHAMAIAAHYDRLAQHYRIVTPAPDVTRTFIEKDRTYALAEACGVDYPTMVAPADPDELALHEQRLRFPVMVKPVRSHEFHAHFGTKLFVVNDLDELRAAFGRTYEAGTPVVICEVIPGSDYRTLERCWYYVGQTGELHVEVYNTKIRQIPPLFGITRVGVTSPHNEELRELALPMLKASGLRGTAGFEFKRDPRDNTLKLIEVNVRIMADLQMYVTAGVDIPWIMYLDQAEGVRRPPPNYPTDHYYVHEIPDIHAMLRHRDPRSLTRFLEPYRTRNTSFAFTSIDDPRPLFRELRRRMTKAARGA